MLINARTLGSEARLAVDVCVIGGGPVGMTLAERLAGTKLSVAVLESGAVRREKATQDLSKGNASSALFNRSNRYLSATRSRMLGGLAGSWHGSCRPFDEEDFTARGWAALSGWPLERQALAAYYAQAMELLELEPAEPAANGELLAGDSRFTSSWLAYAPETALGDRWRRRIARATNVDVLVNANVVALVLDSSGNLVDRVEVRCLKGPSFEVRARHFVLAAGALENARLLLASNQSRPAGLGNGHDLVGRYFMDQLFLRVGVTAMPGRAAAMTAYHALEARPGRRAVIRPTAGFQARHELLNSLATFAPTTLEAGGELAPAIERAVAGQARLAGLTGSEGPGFFGTLTLRGEHLPDRDNRVVLRRSRDLVGLPRLVLAFQPGEHDVWSLLTTARLLGENLGERRLGRLHFDPPRRVGPRRYGWSGYQSGTTRMSREAVSGVVDPDCRVHEVPNLFAAGSSVFPTSGCSGPMLTSLALTLRLADHLRTLLDA